MAKYLDYDGMLYFWSKLKEKFASIGSAFTPKGSASTIPSLTTATIGDVYNMSAEFTTTTDFVEGDGISYPVGTNIICVNSSGTKKWDVLSGFVNLSGYSKTDHNHDSVYSKLGHTHSDYITSEYLGQNYYSKSEIDDDFATSSHNHDDRYYTETEMDTKLNNKANSNHTHTINITANEGAPASYVTLGFGGYYTLNAGGNGITFLMPSYSNAATNSSGLMSAADKTKLNGIATGATADSAITNSEIDTILAS